MTAGDSDASPVDEAVTELRYWATVGPARGRTLGGFTLAVLAELDQLRAQRAAALAIHQRCDDDPGGPPYCRVCVQGGDDFAAPYPCATARALGVTE